MPDWLPQEVFQEVSCKRWGERVDELKNGLNIPSNKANDTSSQQETSESTENPAKDFTKDVVLGG